MPAPWYERPTYPGYPQAAEPYQPPKQPEVPVETTQEHVDRTARVGDKIGYGGQLRPEDFAGVSPSDLAFMMRLAPGVSQTYQDLDDVDQYHKDLANSPDRPKRQYISAQDLKANDDRKAAMPQVMTHNEHMLGLLPLMENYGIRPVPGTIEDPDERKFGPYVEAVDKMGWQPEMFSRPSELTGQDVPMSPYEAARIIAGQLTARRKRMLGTNDPTFLDGGSI